MTAEPQPRTFTRLYITIYSGGKTSRTLGKERKTIMNEVRNINKKRVGDVSMDKRIFEIQLKDCITRIIARPDGTLHITHERIPPAA